MSTIASLIVGLGADASGLTAGLEAGVKGIENFKKRAEKLGSDLQRVGTTLTAGLTLPIAGVGAAALKMAVDATESENLFDVAMGNMVKEGRAFADAFGKPLGLNLFDLRKQLGTFDVMLKGMGLGEQAAFDMSKGLTQLTQDMASFFNLSPDEAFQKLSAGLSGEVEPLKRLGIVINDATVQATALAHGIIKPGEQLSETSKVYARYIAILEKTGLAQGDLARTIESPANQLRILKARGEQILVLLGQQLTPFLEAVLPLFSKFGDFVERVVDRFGKLSTPMKTFILLLAGLAAAAGPVIAVLGAVVAAAAILGGPVLAIGAAVGVVVAALVAFHKQIGEVFGKLVAFLKPIIDTVARILIGVYGVALAPFILAWKLMGKSVVEAVTGLYKSVKELIGKIISVVTAVATGGLSAVTQAWFALGRIITSNPIGKAVVEAFRSVLSFLGGLASKMLAAGKNLLNALIEGFAEAASHIPVVGDKLAKYILGLKVGADSAAAKVGESAGKAVETSLGAKVGKIQTPPITIPTVPTNVVPPTAAQAAKAAGAQYEALADKADRLTTVLDAAREAGADLDFPLRAVKKLYSDVAAQVEAQGGFNERNVKLLAIQRDLLSALGDQAKDVVKATKPGLFPDGLFPAGPLKTPKVDPMALLGGQQKFLSDLDRQVDKIVDRAKDFKVPGVSHLADDLKEVTTGARGLLQVGKSLGAIGDGAAEAIDGVLSLVDSFDQLKNAKDSITGKIDFSSLASGIAGAVGAGLTVLKGIGSVLGFGESEQDKILKKNNERLKEVADGLEHFTVSVGAQVNALKAAQALTQKPVNRFEVLLGDQGAVNQALQNKQIRALLGAQNFMPKVFTDAVNKRLEEFGLTLAELNKIAQDNGIQLLDSKGRVVAKSFDQLQQVLQETLPSLTKFGDTLSAQRSRQELLQEVGLTAKTPTVDLTNALALFDQFSPAIAKTFQGLDATTEEGRSQIQAQLRALAQTVADGNLTLDQLGTFESLDDLTSVILQTQDALNGLSEGVNEATASMLNIPNGFKVQAAEFAAQIPETLGKLGTTLGTPQTLTPPDVTVSASVAEPPHLITALEDLVDTLRRQQSAAVPAPGTTSVNVAATERKERSLTQVILQAGAIRVEAGQRSASQIADEVLQKFRDLARAQTGDTLDTGRLN